MSRIEALNGAIRLCEAVRELAGETEKMGETIESLRAIARDVRYGGEWKGDSEKLAGILDGCGNGICYMCRFNKQSGCRKALKEEAAAALRQQGKTIEDLRKTNARLLTEIEAMRGEAYDSDLKAQEPAEWQWEIMERLQDTAPF